jgi:hypothetical protein
MAKAQRGSDKYTVRIPDGLRDDMLEHCEKIHKTPSELIRIALKWYLHKDDPKELPLKK